MAEISATKGGEAVTRIEGTGQQPGGLARPQVSPPPRSGDRRRQRGEEEAEGLQVEIGEEARRSLQQAPEKPAADSRESEESEEKKEQGAIVDVVV